MGKYKKPAICPIIFCQKFQQAHGTGNMTAQGFFFQRFEEFTWLIE